MTVLDRLVEAVGGETAGARDEFIALLDAHVPELTRRIHVVVGVPELVNNVVQQTMVEALSCWRRYDRSRPIGPWITGIALNVARRYWRRARVAREAGMAYAAVAAAPGAARGPEHEALSRERAALLYEALDRLSPVLRETFLLRAVEDLPAEEVAQITRTTVGAVHTRVSRARDAIRAWMAARQGGEEVGR